MTAAKLPMPVDLATSKAPGYRLDNGNPVIWFAGVDGKNDGGKKAYETPNRVNPAEGKDLIFPYGEIPLSIK